MNTADISSFFAAYGADHDKAGQPVVRMATCECGSAFKQHLLSARFLTACEAIHGGAPLRQVQRQIPEYYVPVHCPPCERVQLGYVARVASYSETPTDHRLLSAGDRD